VYIAFVILVMVISPALSVATEAAASHHAVSIFALTAKWFVFWAVGIRLFTAGVRQALQPQFTAAEIFEIHDPAPYPIVREVGFGNLSMGALGVCSLYRPGWLVPAAVGGGLYFGLAALGHLVRKGKNAMERTALISDTFAFFVLLVVAVRGWA